MKEGSRVNCRLYVVIPCFNEEEMIEITIGKLREKMYCLMRKNMISENSRVLFVDDGSTDKTWEIISAVTKNETLFSGIKLSGNCGHQNALMAGMMYAKNRCDCIVSMDADLQDDIDAVDEFLLKYYDGCEIVYGVRNSRETDTDFKRNSARLFYKLMNFAGAKTVYDHADYRLMSRKALEALEHYKETNLFIRGIVPSLGFKSGYVYYDRKEREAGESKYPLGKMLEFALNGITSFTVKPLRLIFILGMLFSILSSAGLIYALASYFSGVAVKGWTAIVCSVWLLGGVLMLCIGILGEYIGKIYSEVKQRPRYIIEETTEDASEC